MASTGLFSSSNKMIEENLNKRFLLLNVLCLVGGINTLNVFMSFIIT